MKLLVMFGSTYICEQTFSTMNINKTKLRSNLTDVHVQCLLRISTSDMQPEFKQLVDNFDRPQMSHWLQQLLKYITLNSLNTVFGLYALKFTSLKFTLNTIYSLHRWINTRLRYWFSNPARQGLHFPISGPPTGEVAHPCSTPYPNTRMSPTQNHS